MGEIEGGQDLLRSACRDSNSGHPNRIGAIRGRATHKAIGEEAYLLFRLKYS